MQRNILKIRYSAVKRLQHSMYFKCHLAAEGELVAERHHLSLSEMAALRKTHFLSPVTLLTA